MTVRLATTRDHDAVRSLHLSAFPEEEREIVAELAVSLLAEETTPPTISLLAEADGVVVGHVCFSPVTIGSGGTGHGYILAPLGVSPDRQKAGIGSQLVREGIQRLSAMDVDILIVYGDPAYYGRFGFSAEAAVRYRPPYALEYPCGWLGLALREGGDDRTPVKIACVTSLCDPVLW